jgi:HEAT repeat protein
MSSAKSVVIAAVLSLGALMPFAPPKDEPAGPDESLLKEAKVVTEDTSLLDFLRKRAGDDDDLRNLEKLIRQLGSGEFSEREEASKKLVALGLTVPPRLRQARADKDPEVARRARECVEALERSDDWWQPLPAIRLLVRRNPKGAVEELLHYLPYAPDEETREEIWYGLAKIGVEGGKAHPALAAALKDGLAERRALAACLLGRYGTDEQRASVRRLLKDEDASVRLRAAQGLLAGKEAGAVPVLVSLLDEPSIELAWQAEELLAWVAGDDAPEPTLGTGDAAARRKCRTAWEAWWTGCGHKLDFAKVFEDHRRPGLFMVCETILLKGGEFGGKLWVYGCDGRPRWQLAGIGAPGACQWLPGGRILVSEGAHPSQVTERELDGKVVWKYPGENATYGACQRLPNGRTFVSNWPREIFEVSSSGAVTVKHELDGVWDGALRLRNGHVLLLKDHHHLRAGGWEVQEINDTDAREVRTIRPKGRLMRPGGLEALPDGNFLFAATDVPKASKPDDPEAEERAVLDAAGQRRENAVVVEMDAAGESKRVWRVPGATGAVRLRNGNMVVVSQLAGGSIVEMDPHGKVVAETLCNDWGVGCPRPIISLVRVGFDHPRPAGFDLSTSVPWRLKGLRSADALRRCRSARALGDSREQAEVVVPALVKALDDADARVRDAALRALGELGAKSVPELVKALKHPSVRVRVAAVSLLREQGKAAVDPLIVALKDEAPAVRAVTLDALAVAGRGDKSVVPIIVKHLEDENGDVRIAAARALGTLRAEAGDAIPALLAALKGKDVELRYGVASALAWVGPEDKRVVDALVMALKEGEDLRVRDGAAWALGQHGAYAKDAVPALLAALEVTDGQDPQTASYLRGHAAEALGSIGADAARCVPALTALAKNTGRSVPERFAAIEALGKYGPAAKPAVSVLTDLAKGRQHELSGVAAEALLKIQGDK